MKKIMKENYKNRKEKRGKSKQVKKKTKNI